MTNISPITGQCIPCLIKSMQAKAKPMPAVQEYDWKQAQAGGDE